MLSMVKVMTPPAATNPKSPDFAQLFCAQYGVSRQAYRAAVFRRTLYPHARPVHLLIRWANPDYFGADDDFVEGVGRIGSRREFTLEADEFTHHPQNRGFWRRTVRIRVSVGRMRRLVEHVFAESRAPFMQQNIPASH
jgi:hypothetical protein